MKAQARGRAVGWLCAVYNKTAQPTGTPAAVGRAGCATAQPAQPAQPGGQGHE